MSDIKEDHFSVGECSSIKSISELLNDYDRNLLWGENVIPLVKRSSPRRPTANFYSMDTHDFDSTEMIYSNHPKVLVCHDYKGNYRDDKLVDGGRDWEDYRFYNWSVVDIFCYFSHDFVTIPTLQYINAAHKNGVKVIGTLMFEHDCGKNALTHVLNNDETMKNVADSLVNIARTIKFEGWFFDIQIDIEETQIPLLKKFVCYLNKKIHENIDGGVVIMYDSVNAKTGRNVSQKELNSNNEEFFNLCDGIFTNYCWEESNLENTSKFIDAKFQTRKEDVFIGIDIFGRGQTAGFLTNATLSKVKEYIFSTGIFAPGWTHENIDKNVNDINEEFLKCNDKFWSSLYPFLYIHGPKTLPFTTSFCIGSGKNYYKMGKIVKDRWYNLSNQGFQPSTPSSVDHFTHYYEDAFNGGSCLSIKTTELIRIFTCELSCKEGIVFSYTFKKENENCELEIHLNGFEKDKNCQSRYVFKKGVEGDKNIRQLQQSDVRKWFLANNDKQEMPEDNNNWETCFLLFKNADIILTDIGVKKITEGKFLLGQISFYSAIDFEFQSSGSLQSHLNLK